MASSTSPLLPGSTGYCYHPRISNVVKKGRLVFAIGLILTGPGGLVGALVGGSQMFPSLEKGLSIFLSVIIGAAISTCFFLSLYGLARFSKSAPVESSNNEFYGPA